ncbi:MAG: DNA repair protein RadC [Puniceicoccales bacterium]|nr:DNA repair protein RadC [Puniceicoccales bacterium]
MSSFFDKSINYGHRNRLRKKFMRSEFDCFNEHEIVELLLTLSIPRKDVKTIAKTLLKTFGSIKGIFDASISDLVQIKGIGESTAVALKIIRAINSLYLQEQFEGQPLLNSVDKVFMLWKNRLSSLAIEVLEIAYLDSALRLMKNGIERLETGTIAATAVCPRKVAEAALNRKARAIILAHNHPKGAAEPSDYDERNTRTIKIALQYLDIKLIDHIIIASDRAFSFKENGLL